MLKKILPVIAGACLIMSAAVCPLHTQAAHYISSMDIDVNYDPFTDTYKNTEGQGAVSPASEKVGVPFKVGQSKVVPGNMYLPKGLALNVELTNRIDCKAVFKYQTVEFKTTENLFVNDVIVIPKGTTGKGYIYDVQSPGAFGRKGVLRIAGKEITTINGVKVPLMKGISATGKTDGGAVVVGALASVAGGFLMKGKGIAFPIGTDFIVEVREDTDLNCKSEELAKVMDPTVPRGQKVYVEAYQFPSSRNGVK